MDFTYVFLFEFKEVAEEAPDIGIRDKRSSLRILLAINSMRKLRGALLKVGGEIRLDY